jgi:hypothetical protein
MFVVQLADFASEIIEVVIRSMLSRGLKSQVLDIFQLWQGVEDLWYLPSYVVYTIYLINVLFLVL